MPLFDLAALLTPPDPPGPRRLEGAERVIAVRGGGYFPVLIRLKSGALAAVVRGGAPHVGVGGRLDIVKSKDGGRTWTPPRTVVYMPPDSRNPAFGQAPDGALVLAFAVTGPYREGRFVAETRRYTVWVTRSPDEGRSWEPPTRVDISPLEFGSPYGKIATLEDGTMLMCIYGWGRGIRGHATFVFRSRDCGRTWGEPVLVAEGHNEASLLPLGNGRVLAILRTDEGGLSQCTSTDGGKTWGKPRPLVGRGRHPADVIRLHSGNLLLTFGHRLPPYGVMAVLSRDGGKTWDLEGGLLLDWNCANTDCGYPSSVQLEDGTIVTMFYGVGHLSDPEIDGPFAMCVRWGEEAFTSR